MNVNVLVIGGGAREHALCTAVCLSNENVNLFSVMKNVNPGIQKLSSHILRENETNVEKIVQYAKEQKIDIALIGPEAPLEVGLSDELIRCGISTCAPIKNAAKIETDKEWMRTLLRKYHIHGQLRCKSFSDAKKATTYIEELDAEIAIKPIGLTGGKGVKVSGDHFHGINEAMKYIKDVIENKIGGQAKVLIEEKVDGEEFTVQAFSDGHSILPLPAVQDHKRLLPDDKGPNTGGMGSYSCNNGLLPFLSRGEYEESGTILQSIVEALNKEETPYIGPIYGQFILTADGIKIIEINARFGDPEIMNILPLIQTDFLDLCLAMNHGSLTRKKLQIQKKSTVCKYVVPEGYGVKSLAGKRIFVDEDKVSDIGSLMFYASVNKENNYITTTNSRSLAVIGIAGDLDAAEQQCEQALKYVKGDHIFIRHDIGTRKLIEKRISHMKKLRGM